MNPAAHLRMSRLWRRAGGKATVWMPATVAILGLLSIAMLVWTDQISQRQRMHFALANTLTDLRINVASAYLSLEEAILRSEAGHDIESTWSQLREATRLSEVLLSGGQSDDGVILAAPRDVAFRRHVEEIARRLSDCAALAHERYESVQAGRLDPTIESRMAAAFGDLQRSAAVLETVVDGNEASDYAEARRLFLGIFLAWSAIVVASTTGLLQRERRRRYAEDALQAARNDLEIKVAERTTELRRLNVELGIELGERKKTEAALKESEEQLRQLSARLLAAQEAERRRIATELHDALGHSLVVMKLRLGRMAKEWRNDPAVADEGWKSLSQFIDQVIEDVRRLSRDLRPSVLEDLGLSAALRWLANNCDRNGRTRVESSIIDLHHLVSRDAEVVLYRIIQEALTNAEKHAAATRVSLTVERREDRLAFVVEDDGRGFDVREAIVRTASARGLGLATMQERARMVRGSLSVWSEHGKGTRITLGLPVRNGERVS